MNELLEKAYNCYIRYLNKLNYGTVTQNYCLLYDSILYIANDINDEQFYQYFVNNLNCKGAGSSFELDITDNMDRLILWTLNSSDTVLGTFTWNTVPAPQSGNYSFVTNSVSGYNWLYLSVPQDVNLLIYNELNIQLYDSNIAAGNPSQLFTLVGTMTTVNGHTNNVYRKNDVFNSLNSVLFKITI